MHGVSFINSEGTTYESYINLFLILNSKEIKAPTIKTNHVDIVGANGFLDLTEAFGEAKYNNRELRFVFTIIPLITDTTLKFNLFSNVQDYLHGRMMKIILDEETGHYYYGRVSVENFTNEKGIPVITMTCDCDPFKYDVAETVVSRTISGGSSFSLSNDRMRVVPTITSSASMTFQFENNEYTHAAGTFQIPELELKEGSNSIYVSGSGTVTFRYRKGRL